MCLFARCPDPELHDQHQLLNNKHDDLKQRVADTEARLQELGARQREVAEALCEAQAAVDTARRHAAAARNAAAKANHERRIAEERCTKAEAKARTAEAEAVAADARRKKDEAAAADAKKQRKKDEAAAADAKEKLEELLKMLDGLRPAPEPVTPRKSGLNDNEVVALADACMAEGKLDQRDVAREIGVGDPRLSEWLNSKRKARESPTSGQTIRAGLLKFVAGYTGAGGSGIPPLSPYRYGKIFGTVSPSAELSDDDLVAVFDENKRRYGLSQKAFAATWLGGVPEERLSEWINNKSGARSSPTYASKIRTELRRFADQAHDLQESPAPPLSAERRKIMNRVMQNGLQGSRRELFPA